MQQVQLFLCQTGNQCALFWKMFEISLGKEFYADGFEGDPKFRLVEMFHAGTPQSVKDHVLAEIGKEDSCLRTLVVTTAFGMGVDCKTVRRVIHFGPSKTIEAYLQECGRSGHDTKNSQCYSLYNGFLASHCQIDMKQYVTGTSCRRKCIENNFPGIHPLAALGCLCFDVCLAKCQCLAACSSDILQLSKEKKDPVPPKMRSVTQKQKENPQTKGQVENAENAEKDEKVVKCEKSCLLNQNIGKKPLRQTKASIRKTKKKFPHFPRFRFGYGLFSKTRKTRKFVFISSFISSFSYLLTSKTSSFDW